MLNAQNSLQRKVNFRKIGMKLFMVTYLCVFRIVYNFFNIFLFNMNNFYFFLVGENPVWTLCALNLSQHGSAGLASSAYLPKSPFY